MKANGYLGADVKVPVLAEMTKNFSGAEIEGLVKSASSYALYGSIDVSQGAAVSAKPKFDNIMVTMADFKAALEEVKPAFGVAEEELGAFLRNNLIPYGDDYDKIVRTIEVLTRQVKTSEQTSMLSVLLEGAGGTGKTSIAAHLAMRSDFPYIKLISPEHFVGYASDMQKCGEITKVFEDAYKSPFSIIILDDLERLLEYVPIGPRFSNNVLQTLLVLIKKKPPHENRKLMIMATTSSLGLMQDMDLRQAFNVILKVPQLTTPDQVRSVLNEVDVEVSKQDLDEIAEGCHFPIGIKSLLLVVEMARQDHPSLTAKAFLQALRDCGLSRRIVDSRNLGIDIE